ncbi:MULTISPECIES: hypothetical protein [unclassified Bradyrhizobium]|uniref:hypothetical protein n=1 Tax=unclassified Bradyrhizobium TaxID=2631580 RepID=UPI0028EBA63D|nr:MULTISPECIES: hypothetical protein [unclassified Bradyrhizobium]
MAFTDVEKLAEIDRELHMRHRVYKWQIRSGKLTQDQAARQIAVLTAIRMDYAEKVKRAEPIGPLFA